MTDSASSRLEKNKEKILHAWEQRTVQEISASGKQSSLALRDSLPEYINHLVKALSIKVERLDARKKVDVEESTRVGKKHGRERAQSPHYTMDQMILEYHILRQVMCDILEEELPLSTVEREVIVCSIEKAVNDAATEFSDYITSLNDELSEEKILRDKFVTSLTHDLRTPLATIKLIAQMLVKRTPDPEEIKSSSDRIVKGVTRIDTMIQDLLDFTHFRAGEKLPLTLAVCDLNKLLTSTLEELTAIHGKRFTLMANNQFDILCDSNAVKRIIENLATNAVKYGSPSTPITISISRQNSTLELSVHNNGNPIKPEDQIIIFEPFKRTESAEKSSQKGWGIGLPLVRGLAEAHGGSARVESSAHGTTFVITIPV